MGNYGDLIFFFFLHLLEVHSALFNKWMTIAFSLCIFCFLSCFTFWSRFLNSIFSPLIFSHYFSSFLNPLCYSRSQTPFCYLVLAKPGMNVTKNNFSLKVISLWSFTHVISYFGSVTVCCIHSAVNCRNGKREIQTSGTGLRKCKRNPLFCCQQMSVSTLVFTEQ